MSPVETAEPLGRTRLNRTARILITVAATALNLFAGAAVFRGGMLLYPHNRAVTLAITALLVAMTGSLIRMWQSALKDR
jgi:hypothetical protein